MGSQPFLFQHIKLCRFTNFHAGIIKCTIVPLRGLTIQVTKTFLQKLYHLEHDKYGCSLSLKITIQRYLRLYQSFCFKENQL